MTDVVVSLETLQRIHDHTTKARGAVYNPAVDGRPAQEACQKALRHLDAVWGELEVPLREGYGVRNQHERAATLASESRA